MIEEPEYFVVQNHTLVYEDPIGHLYILQASVLRGSSFYPSNGSIARPMNPDLTRKATIKDFEEFRVLPHLTFETPERG